MAAPVCHIRQKRAKCTIVACRMPSLQKRSPSRTVVLLLGNLCDIATQAPSNLQGSGGLQIHFFAEGQPFSNMYNRSGWHQGTHTYLCCKICQHAPDQAARVSTSYMAITRLPSCSPSTTPCLELTFPLLPQAAPTQQLCRAYREGSLIT